VSPAVAVAWTLAVALTAALFTWLLTRPQRAVLADARLRADDLEDRLVAEQAARDFRDRFDVTLDAATAEPATLRTALRALAELVPESEVSLLLAMPDEPRLGWVVRLVDGTLLPAEPLPGTPTCTALDRGATHAVSSSRALDACPHLGSELDGLPTSETCAVCLPLRAGDHVIGSVCVTGAPGEVPDEDAVRTMEWVLSRTGARLDAQRRRREPVDRLRKDPVTDLPGTDVLRHQLQELVRSLTPFCVAVLDVDNYAALVAADGVAAGDAALRSLADTAVTVLRPGDLVCRVEGPRIAAVLGRCRGEDAVRAVERVREAVTLSLAEGDLPHFTVSAGLVESHRAVSIDHIFEMADETCGAAHAAGGNRVEIY
jgi:diguanylate cyclase (GGDEF)-like protein